MEGAFFGPETPWGVWDAWTANDFFSKKGNRLNPREGYGMHDIEENHINLQERLNPREGYGMHAEIFANLNVPV